MATSLPHETREEQALAEIAATRVTPAGAWTSALLLLAILAVGSLMEGARSLRGEATAFAGGAPIPTPRELFERWRAVGPLTAHGELRAALLGLEDRLGRESALSATLRPAAQTVLARQLGYGNSQVLVGKKGWLYFRTEFDYLTGHPFLAPRELGRRRTAGARYAVAQPDPIPGLIALRDELAERGIELVFFPVPVKAQVHPEPLVRFDALHRGSRQRTGDYHEPDNPSFPELVRRLGEAGLPVYDALPDLRAAAATEVLYLATDTHWNAAGMRIAAAGLARFLARETALPSSPPSGLRRRGFAHVFQGDLTRILGKGLGGAIFADENTELDEIVGLGDVPFSATAISGGDVLLLGDSYSLVFSAVEGGKSAGFAEQLAFALDRPVRRSAKYAANDLADRVQWLRQDPALLEGTRVVVYEVTARALASADWTAGSIPPQSPQEREP
ncbi:MAG: hypothetical protein ABIV06_03770 [Thermoanaerobaculia bacterium]